MPFPTGVVTFNVFEVTGSKYGNQIVEEVLDKLREKAIKPIDEVAPEVDYGWCGGRHVFDNEFSFANNVFGDALFFGMRIDTNKCPGDVKRAYIQMEQNVLARSNPSGFISKLQKKEARDLATRKIDEEKTTGKFLRSKVVPVLWDFQHGVVYTSATSATLDKLAELFKSTFDIDIELMTPNSVAEQKDPTCVVALKPTRFITQYDEDPEYPWSGKHVQPRSYLGNEFLMWVWHNTLIQNEEAFPKDCEIFFDRRIELECAFNQSGHEILKGDGPHRMPEAFAALRQGKVPRKAGMQLVLSKDIYSMVLNPETFQFSGVKLPEIEDADTARVVFEERIRYINELVTGVKKLFLAFLYIRTRPEKWQVESSKINNWIESEKVEV